MTLLLLHFNINGWALTPQTFMGSLTSYYYLKQLKSSCRRFLIQLIAFVHIYMHHSEKSSYCTTLMAWACLGWVIAPICVIESLVKSYSRIVSTVLVGDPSGPSLPPACINYFGVVRFLNINYYRIEISK